MARKLKVFEARFGFYDAVIAVPSQAAALRAWGTTQNLFAEGQARLCADGEAVAAALAQPETLLRRAVGTTDPFSLTPRPPRAADLPDVAGAVRRRPAAAPDAEPRSKPLPRASRTTPAKRPPPPPPPPDRSALDAAEGAMRAVERAWREQAGDFARRRAALDAEERAATTAHNKARDRAERDRGRAAEDYRAAGSVIDTSS